MIDEEAEMMKYFGMLLNGKFDKEETFWFSRDFLRDMMNNENKKQIMLSIVDKKGYLIIDCKKGEYDKKRDAYSMTVYYMAVQSVFT